ncbi:substrate-binding domain-containing protein [Thermoclostridium stercorarium]|uniref:substrate-binding domain-containing protein n=1 Tax=Thermoclostridium stercorarium TaxID=1510 RepID=UPI0022498E67|nr:substrate-binding domain-containing protein [Thermoclostridium stercorarium]UZQ84597.1 substrate-binding domain-containing protein [Thermoclostridium stercorarium]
MRKNEKPVVVFISHILTSVFPIVLITLSFFYKPEILKLIIYISLFLALAGNIPLILISIRMNAEYKFLTETLLNASNGDLLAAMQRNKNKGAKGILTEFEKFIKYLDDVFSKVGHSAEEVKHLVNTVKATSKEASEVANQIAASAELVSKGAIEQANDAEESTKITSELLTMFEEVAKSAEIMTRKAENTKAVSEFGKANINELLDKSKLTEINMGEINSKINELNKMAENIDRITTAMAQIAGQTNLLALNASIEAARAGEAGKGFGVVAEQIKRLAQQSAVSSEEIKKIVLGIQNQINVTTETILATSDTIRLQTQSVYKTRDAFNEISKAINDLYNQLIEVKTGIGILDKVKQKLYNSIANISSVAEKTVASTQEIATLMFSQTNSSEILVQLSESFDTLIKNLDDALNKFNYTKVEARKRSFAIIPCVDIEFFSETREGAEDAAAKLGVDLIWRAPEKYDSRLQAELIDEVVAMGVSGIGIGPIDGPEVRESLKKAMNMGIKVICFDTDIPDIGRDAFIGTDNYKAGITFGELVAKKLNYKGRVIGTQAKKQTLNQKERMAGFIETIKKYPDIELVEICETDEKDGERRWQAVKAFIQKIRNFDCFICMDASGSYIAGKIREELGITPVCVVFDKTEYSEKPVRDGYTTVLAQRPRLWGELCVRRLNELCNGKTIKEKEDTGIYEINRNNVNIFFK